MGEYVLKFVKTGKQPDSIPGIEIKYSPENLFYIDQIKGRAFWDDADTRRIMSERFKRYMASMEPLDGNRVRARLFCGKTEVLSCSFPYSTHGKKLSKQELDGYAARLEKLGELGRSPDASERMSDISNRFPVADPKEDPELFRVYKYDGEWRLAVIWGLTGTTGEKIASVGTHRLPVSGDRRSWAKLLILLLSLLLSLLLAALIGLLCWHYFGKEKVGGDDAVIAVEDERSGLRLERGEARLLPDGKYEMPARFCVGEKARRPRAFCDGEEITIAPVGPTEKFLTLSAGEHVLELREDAFLPPPKELSLRFTRPSPSASHDGDMRGSQTASAPSARTDISSAGTRPVESENGGSVGDDSAFGGEDIRAVAEGKPPQKLSSSQAYKLDYNYTSGGDSEFGTVEIRVKQKPFGTKLRSVVYNGVPAERVGDDCFCIRGISADAGITEARCEFSDGSSIVCDFKEVLK